MFFLKRAHEHVFKNMEHHSFFIRITKGTVVFKLPQNPNTVSLFTFMLNIAFIHWHSLHYDTFPSLYYERLLSPIHAHPKSMAQIHIEFQGGQQQRDRSRSDQSPWDILRFLLSYPVYVSFNSVYKRNLYKKNLLIPRYISCFSFCFLH